MNPRRNGDPGFRVTTLNSAQQNLRSVYRRARTVGRVADVSQAMRAIFRQLRADARNCGEETGNMPNARLTMRTVALAPVIVIYGVHDEHPEVFIRNVIDMFGDIP